MEAQLLEIALKFAIVIFTCLIWARSREVRAVTTRGHLNPLDKLIGELGVTVAVLLVLAIALIF